MKLEQKGQDNKEINSKHKAINKQQKKPLTHSQPKNDNNDPQKSTFRSSNSPKNKTIQHGQQQAQVKKYDIPSIQDDKIKNSYTKMQPQCPQENIDSQNQPLKSEQNMNQEQKQMLEGYKQALWYLENPQNKNKIQNILSTQINYLRASECPVCCFQFDLQSRKPMKVCKQSPIHLLCNQCLKKQPNIQKHSRCFICRASINTKYIKEQTQLLNWLQVNKRIQIDTPKIYGQIPLQLYQCLRKISYHNFCKIDFNRLKESKQHLFYDTLRLKTINEQMKNKKKQQQIELKQLQQKIKVTLQSYESIKKELQHLRFSTIHKSQFNLKRVEKYIQGFQTKKQKVRDQFQFFKVTLPKYRQISLALAKHQIQKHEGQSLYCNPINSLLTINHLEQCAYSFFKTNVPEKCQECEQLIKEVKDKIEELELQRKKNIPTFYRFMRSYSNVAAFLIDWFVPKNVEQFRQDRRKYFHLIQNKEVSILEEIQKQQFQNMDIDNFWQMLKSDHFEGDQQQPIVKMGNVENSNYINKQ